MKKTIISLVLSFMYSFCFSQATLESGTHHIQWGKMQRLKGKKTISKLICNDETGTYFTKMKIREELDGIENFPIIEYFNSDMVYVNSLDLKKAVDKKHIEYEEIIAIDGNIYLFYVQDNKSKKTKSLLAQKINKNNLSLNPEIFEIEEISYQGIGPLLFQPGTAFYSSKSPNYGSYKFKVNTEETRVLVHYSLPHQRNENAKFGFHVLDKELKPIWEKEVTVPYESLNFYIESYYFDNEENAFLLAKYYYEENNDWLKWKTEKNFYYVILAFENKGSSFKEYTIQSKGKSYKNMQIAINKQKDLICVGLYSNEDQPFAYSIAGSYFLKIDRNTKKITHQNYQEFGTDLITQNLSKSEVRKTKKEISNGNKPEMYNYNLGNIIFRDDGGVVLVAEKITTKNSSLSSKDLIVINISPTGEIDWAEKIAKFQYAFRNLIFFTSYTSAVVDDKIFIIFNDHKKNMDYRGEGSYKPLNLMNGKNKAVLTLVQLDSRGGKNKKAISFASETNVPIKPYACDQISHKEMVIFGQYGKNYRLAKLKFE